MFNEKFVNKHVKNYFHSKVKYFTSISITVGETRDLILQMDDGNYREILTVLREFGVFNNSIVSFPEDDVLIEQNKDKFELIRFLSEIDCKNGKGNLDHQEYFKKLFNKHFPIWGNVLDKYYNNFELFNGLQTAAFRSKVLSNPKVFKQYCKEVEILFLAISDNDLMFDNLLMENDVELTNKVIEEINKNYYAFGCSFGYKVLNETRLLSKIDSIGYNEFVKGLNRTVDNKLLDYICEDIDSMFSKSIFSTERRIQLVNAVLSIPKADISIQTVYFITCLLKRDKDLRISSRIVEHLPKVKDTNFPKNDSYSYLLYSSIAEFIKISEVELGIKAGKEYELNYKFSLSNLSTYLSNDYDFDQVYEEEIFDFCMLYFKTFDNTHKTNLIEGLTLRVLQNMVFLTHEKIPFNLFKDISNCKIMSSGWFYDSISDVRLNSQATPSVFFKTLYSLLNVFLEDEYTHKAFNHFIRTDPIFSELNKQSIKKIKNNYPPIKDDEGGSGLETEFDKLCCTILKAKENNIHADELEISLV